MIVLGVDPDLHCTALATWGDDPESLWADTIKIPAGITRHAAVLAMTKEIVKASTAMTESCDMLVVEAQVLRPYGNDWHRRPEDIVLLGNVAGAALAAWSGSCYGNLRFPTPQEWKRGVPKAAHQARAYEGLGWGYELRTDYAIPKNPPKALEHIRPSEWKHVGDALLLARWGWEQTRRKR